VTYKIIATDIASCYCISHESSANTHPQHEDGSTTGENPSV